MVDKTPFINFLSPAKLNLGLKVTNRLENGYHELKTVFCLIDMFDQIEISVTNNGKISLIEHNQAWFYQTDLAYKAAILLKDTYNVSYGANIKVKKIIPSGAGLGGGSSNAATVLVALNFMWKLNLTKDELINLGRTLGADVPFFIYGINSYATGIGDIFTPIEITQQYFVLIQPKCRIPTKEIFSNMNIDFKNVNPNINSEYLINTLDNDLYSIAKTLYPELEDIVKSISNLGDVAMTGSGSVIYLRFFDENIAKKVAQNLKTRYNSYLVKSLGKSPIFND